MTINAVDRFRLEEANPKTHNTYRCPGHGFYFIEISKDDGVLGCPRCYRRHEQVDPKKLLEDQPKESIPGLEEDPDLYFEGPYYDY